MGPDPAGVFGGAAALGQLRNPASARGWLLTIFCATALYKENQRFCPVPATTVGLDFDALPREVAADDEVDRDRLQAVLAAIPPDFRVVLLMFYFEDCSYREIAQQLGLPMGTVMSRLARAKGHLRAQLFPSRPARRRERTITALKRRRPAGSEETRLTEESCGARALGP